MKNLLNAVDFFGITVGWDQLNTIIWLIVIQAIIVVLAISLIIYLLLRRRYRQTEQEVVYTVAQQPTTQVTEGERELIGISLDLAVVQRMFTAGDDFNCEGLIVNGEYNLKPRTQSFIEFTIVDKETYSRLQKKEQLEDVVYIIKPDMDTTGKKVVTVIYEGLAVAYAISVEEQATSMEENRELMYIWLDADNVQKDYVVGDSVVDDGLIVMAHYNVEPYEEEVFDYSVLTPDMSKVGRPTVTITYQGKTVGYRINVSEAAVVEEPAPEPVVEEEPVLEAEEEVVEQPIIVEQQPTIVVQHSDPIIVEEESISSRLRYDKSFTARLIQSDDEVKYWYTDIKNELFSFKTVHGRMSWKRETFKWHKDVIAKLAYRGKQLCIFLPLNPYDYADTNHPVEDASDMSCYEDTPLMIRLKSNRRVKFAKQLIATVMEQKGIARVPHETVDYYMPYEGILELINKGLIKREIKLPEDEAIFDQEKVIPDELEDESFQLTEVAPGVYVTKRD